MPSKRNGTRLSWRAINSRAAEPSEPPARKCRMTMIAAEIVEGMGDAAFAARPQEGIIAWNEDAQRLLGYRSSDVLGRPCHQVLAGRDVFGNEFCCESCALVRMAQSREAIARFDVRYRSGREESSRSVYR